MFAIIVRAMKAYTIFRVSRDWSTFQGPKGLPWRSGLFVTSPDSGYWAYSLSQDENFKYISCLSIISEPANQASVPLDV